MTSGDYPSQLNEITLGGWGEVYLPVGSPERVSLPEMTLLTDFVPSGGGYGDPLDRTPELVARDVSTGATSMEIAQRVYGVIMDSKSYTLDLAKTEVRRREIREDRLREGKPLSGSGGSEGRDRGWKTILRIHEYLEIARDGGDTVIRCLRCGYLFCNPKENYKKYSLRRVLSLEEVALNPLPSGEPYLGHYHEYICPGCATLLQMDVFCPGLGGEEDLWDIRVDVA